LSIWVKRRKAHWKTQKGYKGGISGGEVYRRKGNREQGGGEKKTQSDGDVTTKESRTEIERHGEKEKELQR